MDEIKHTSYEKIYENILAKFRSYEIPLMNEDDVVDTLHDYLIFAISQFHLCRKDLSDRNDILQRFNVELSDDEINILGNYALLEYLDSTYIRTPTLLKVNLSSSDFNSYSPANMLDKLMNMHETYRKENETLISRYSWMGMKENKKVDLSSFKGYKKS
jgi:hypothetical protein